jgi:hypothetical protein
MLKTGAALGSMASSGVAIWSAHGTSHCPARSAVHISCPLYWVSGGGNLSCCVSRIDLDRGEIDDTRAVREALSLFFWDEIDRSTRISALVVWPDNARTAQAPSAFASSTELAAVPRPFTADVRTREVEVLIHHPGSMVHFELPPLGPSCPTLSLRLTFGRY